MPKDESVFCPNEDNLSLEHFRYRNARAKLGVSHERFHQLAAEDSGAVSASLAATHGKNLERQCRRKRKVDATFNPQPYVMPYVERVLAGKIDPVSLKPFQQEQIAA